MAAMTMMKLGQLSFCGRRWHVMHFSIKKEFSRWAFTKTSTEAPNLPPIISQQIERATTQLDETQQEQYPDITTALEKGIVKPFFHTLLLPDPFLNSHRSFRKVTAGGVSDTRDVELDELGWNLDDVIDATGKGARLNFDDGMGVGSKWKYNPFQTAFAVELVNTDTNMLGEGIECTNLGFNPIKLSPEGMLCQKLLTRPESRGIVAETFHRFAEMPMGSVSAITGLPGIGKSWTLFYALQQALQYDRANVLFYFQKTENAVMYLRRNNKIYAWKSTSSIARSELFNRADVLVLLDPKEAKEGGAAYVSGNVKLMYAASNNEDHFKGSAEKDFGNIQAYLGPPLDNELFVILAQLYPKLEQAIIQERKENIGNLIRYMDEEKYDKRLEATQKAIKNCGAKENKLLETALDGEEISSAYKTIPGTLFEVLPKRPASLTDIGYDGQQISYRERVIRVINDGVRDLMLQASRRK